MNTSFFIAVLLGAAVMFYGSSCSPQPRPEELDKLGTLDMTIKGKNFRLWVADDLVEQANGLMFVNAARMAPLPDGTQRGMIFVFDYEQHLSFWMRNTIIPLDIVYLTNSGVITALHTMAALDERPNQYPSAKPARIAIEVSAGVFTDLGLKPGDQIALPDGVLKRRP